MTARCTARIWIFGFLATAALGLLGGLAVGAQQKEKPDEQRERDAFEREVATGSTLPIARARLTAFFDSRLIPLWKNADGTSPRWQEMGPSVIQHSWGGMDNAGRTSMIAISPADARVLYLAAASGGIWKSVDEGKNWKPIGDHLASLSVGAITVDPFHPEIVYAGLGEPHYSLDSFHGAGFLRSLDGGQTWDLLASDVFMDYTFSRIVPNPSRPGFLYAATSRGVFRSLDYGATWVQLLKGPATDLLLDPRSPSILIASIGLPWGSPTNGLYKSTDAGASWIKLARDLPTDPMTLGRIQMDQCAAYPNVIYASLYGKGASLVGLYKSADFGENWLRMPNAPSYAGGQAWYDNCIAVCPTNPNVIFVGGFSTFRSMDGGETWEDNTRSYSGGRVHPDHHSLTFSLTNPKTLYLCTDGGAFRSRNLGETWESVSNGLGTVQFQSVDVHPTDDKIAYGGTQDNGTNKFTGSTAWTNIFLGDGGTTHVNWKDPNVVYTEYVNLTILKSKDAGQNWDGATDGIDPTEGKLFYAPFVLDPNDPDTLIAGAQKVYRTTDAANHWSAISPILGARVSAVTVAPNLSKVIYAGTSDGRVWVTPDTGKQWFEITKGLPKGYVGDICVDPRNARHVYVALSGWSPNRIWKSLDAGGTWKNVSDGLPDMPIQALSLDPRHPDTVFIGTSIGVFASKQGGGRWVRYGAGLPNVPVFSIVANKQTDWLTVGTHGRGAWRVKLPQ
ncbi:MAG: hypothetical protein P4L46_21920 [Fimbriimonas sp.]|nr:hypothetical protein [Fimbriimonas sp.]